MGEFPLCSHMVSNESEQLCSKALEAALCQPARGEELWLSWLHSAFHPFHAIRSNKMLACPGLTGSRQACGVPLESPGAQWPERERKGLSGEMAKQSSKPSILMEKEGGR